VKPTVSAALAVAFDEVSVKTTSSPV